MLQIKDYVYKITYRGSENGKINARRALRKFIGPELSLEVINHSYLKDLPHILISFSHTHNYGAVLLASKKKYDQVGIDIEFKSRQVKEGAAKFFCNDQDSLQDYLKLWVLKEAAFKAIWPSPYSLSKPLLLKDIWIHENEFGLIGQKTSLGIYNFEEILVVDQTLLVGMAFLNPSDD